MDLQKGNLLVLLWMLCAVGAQETTMRRRERDTVTLHTGVTDVQKDSQILWSFGSGIEDLIAQLINGATQTDINERFGDRLELDTQTGSLTIRNLNTSDSGVYRVHRVKGKLPVTEFQLVVYKSVSKPEIRLLNKRQEVTDRELVVSKPQTRTQQQDTEVQSSSCRLLCSVENDRDVTLSWTRGKEMLNQTSNPHLNTTLSLPLDIEEQCFNYSCVSSNPVSEESLQVNMTICWEVSCHSDRVPRSPVAVRVVSAVFLLCVLWVVVLVWTKRRARSRRNVTGNPHLEEPVNSFSSTDEPTSLDNIQYRCVGLSPKAAAQERHQPLFPRWPWTTEDMFWGETGPRICLLFLLGGMLCAVGAQETTMRRRERDTVTLHTGVTDVQKDSQILWYSGSGIEDLIAQLINGATQTDINERFRDRLELDTQTGSLTIRNLNTSDSGVYRVHRVKGKLPVTEFQLVVYKAAPKPEIRHVRRRREATDRELVSKPRTRTRQQDTEVQSSSCRLLCSVENDRDVTLSWTRGKEMLNQTSSPHLNTTLSLHLDIEEQDNDTYSCVSSNPVSEESLQVNVTICWEVFRPSETQRSYTLIAVLVPVAVVLVIAVIYFMCEKQNHSKSNGEVYDEVGDTSTRHGAVCPVDTGSNEVTYADIDTERKDPQPLRHQPLFPRWPWTTEDMFWGETGPRICLLFLLGGMLCAVGAQETTMRRRERDTVTLHTGVTDVQKDSVILWYFRSGVDDLIAQFIKGETETDFDERFRDRLELDTQTGSLTIRNLNTSDSGVYRVHRVKGKPPVTEFQLVVYKAAPKPEIRHVRRRREATDRELVSKPRTRTRQQDTEVQSSSCRLLCSVENDRDVTLSWTRGKEMLNQTSSPHLNTTLSLHLDIEEQDNDTYSCVSSNPVSEESLQVNVTICWEGFRPSETQRSYTPIAVLVPVAVVLVTAVIYFMCKKQNHSKIKDEGAVDTDSSEVTYTAINSKRNDTQPLVGWVNTASYAVFSHTHRDVRSSEYMGHYGLYIL
ncbi:uncharacterized protein LOC108929987 [Scleropages formosus]|uniref:uncharacterized protein LOC108929987 n=1 Tax=Scleropages formosus TaxID=113540 RepID=UPI0010FA79ED|nr:uncharacterized protein LOC108929987 [Scleropages formosus]